MQTASYSCAAKLPHPHLRSRLRPAAGTAHITAAVAGPAFCAKAVPRAGKIGVGSCGQ